MYISLVFGAESIKGKEKELAPVQRFTRQFITLPSEEKEEEEEATSIVSHEPNTENTAIRKRKAREKTSGRRITKEMLEEWAQEYIATQREGYWKKQRRTVSVEIEELKDETDRMEDIAGSSIQETEAREEEEEEDISEEKPPLPKKFSEEEYEEFARSLNFEVNKGGQTTTQKEAQIIGGLSQNPTNKEVYDEVQLEKIMDTANEKIEEASALLTPEEFADIRSELTSEPV